MKWGLILLPLLLWSMPLGAQTLLSGRVTDRRTGEAIPGTNVFVEGSTTGTSTSADGGFRIRVPAEYVGRSLVFSYIGYRSQSVGIPAAAQSDLHIRLEQMPMEIGEAVVMPDDQLQVLLAQAYRRIGNNYPREQSRMRGFIREYTRNRAGEYLYFSEALIETYLNSYRIEGTPQIRIVKSVAGNFPFQSQDSLPAVLNYGLRNGVYSGISYHDFVKRKSRFIDPEHYKKFDYHMEAMTEYNGRPVYVVSFRSKNETTPGEIGKLFIDKESLAYLGAEWEPNAAWLNRIVGSYDLPGRSARHTVQYAEGVDGRLYLKYATYDIDFVKDFQAGLEYVTTDQAVDSLGRRPSYTERVNPYDNFLLDGLEHHDESYWDEYNVLQRDSALNTQLQVHFDTVRSRQLIAERLTPAQVPDSAEMAKKLKQIRRLQKAIRGIGRFDIRYGFRYLPATGAEGRYELGIAGTSAALSETLEAFEYYIPASSFRVDFSLDKRWSIHYIYSSTFGEKKLTYRANEWGVAYEFLLDRWRGTIGELSLSYGHSTVARNFSIYRNGEEFRLFGRKFDADRLRFGVGYATRGLTPRIGVRHQLNRNWWIYANAGIYLPLETRQRLFVREKQGGGRRKGSGPLDEERVTLRYNGVQTTESRIALFRWDATAGLMLRF